jgi:hypothetical protein
MNDITQPETKEEGNDVESFPHTCTYSPEDNKIRITPAFRIPKPEWEEMKNAGYKWAPIQEVMVATWSIKAEDIALAMCGEIGDEDQPLFERSADRAERFEGYMEKREGEAVATMDKHDSGSCVHAFQSRARAERSARNRSRLFGKGQNLWSKAEYWRYRTAGVISHALHKSAPAVRMRRIKMLESEERTYSGRKTMYENSYKKFESVLTLEGEALRYNASLKLSRSLYASDYTHPRNPELKDRSLCDLLTMKNDPITGTEAANMWLSRHENPKDRAYRYLEHLQNRLEYERAMLAADGGTGTNIEIVAGGTYNGRLIVKVTKDRMKRPCKIVLETVPGADYWTMFAAVIKSEKIDPKLYVPPTEEGTKKIEAKKEARKKAKKEGVPMLPLINPTKADAQAIQDKWNAERKTKSNVVLMTGAEWQARNGGTYAPGRVSIIHDDMSIEEYSLIRARKPGLFRMRTIRDNQEGDAPRSVVIITDGRNHALPVAPVETQAQAQAKDLETVEA